MSSSEDGDGDLMGPGVDLAMSLSGVLIIVVVIIAQLWLAQNSHEPPPATPPATHAEVDPLRRAEGEIGRLQNLVSGMQDELAQAKNDANTQGVAADTARTDIRSLRRAVDGATQVVKATEGRLAAAEGERDRVKQTLDALSKQLADKKEKQSATEGRLAAAAAERDQTKQALDAVSKLLAGEKRKHAATQAALKNATDKPPLISISDESFRTFEEGSAVISARLAQYLAGTVATLDDHRKRYGTSVIEVVGHTDEVRIRKKDFCNLDDELLEVLNGRKEAKVLAACDNVALGMARATAVVNEFKKLGLEKDFTLLPLSAGPAISTEETLAPGNQGGAPNPSRRRIDIRLKRRGE
jgi:flagellar motor protein MotB